MGLGQAMSGRLYGIGVGPGDPELVTIKAARLIAMVPVIAYPAPDGGRSLARAIAAPFIPLGRTELALKLPIRPGPAPEDAYDAAAAQLAGPLEAGRAVAVLCEGDPLFYGSFIYLMERLAGRFAVTIVPGVTSLSACAAAAALPLARRDGIFTALPATLDDTALEARLAGPGAVAILKVGRHASRLRALLERRGLAERAVLVAHAGRGDQQVVPMMEWHGEAPYFSTVLIPESATGGAP
jgi:precorrin-2/cobalt-factor-2 C20-methyltransferase